MGIPRSFSSAGRQTFHIYRAVERSGKFLSATASVAHARNVADERPISVPSHRHERRELRPARLDQSWRLDTAADQFATLYDFTVPAATNYDLRFYRAVLAP